MLKHALIADSGHFEELINRGPQAVFEDVELVIKSVDIKARIVEKDPFESGVRKLLNFGHTIGHAIETYFLNHKTPILHGMAVASGMICENIVAMNNGLLEKAVGEEINNKIKQYFTLPARAPADMEIVTSLTLQDKKNINGDIMMSLLKNKGEAVFNQKVTQSEILKSLELYAGANHEL
jgi:3-dehydroquinate synthase